jgi:transcriptional regulator with XRE-family HTH domain
MSGDIGSTATLRADLLDRRDFRQALRARDFGMVFRLLRRHQGTTQAQIAAATGLTQGRVSKLMSDLQMRVMHIDVIERIADGLRIPGVMVGLAARPWETGELERDESEQGEDHVLRRTALRAGGALLMGGLVEALDSEPDAMNSALDTSNISPERLSYFEATAERLGVDVIQVVPTQILSTTVSHFRSVRRLVREQQKTAHRVRLVRTGAQYATVVGEILFNQGSFELATMWYKTAYRAAVDIGDRYLADIALAGQSYIPTYSDDPTGVVRITGARLDRRLTPSPAVAWLWGFNAKAHAALGAADAARRAFDHARQALDESPRSQVRPGIFSFVEEKLEFYEASAFVTLGDAANAVSAADRALKHYDPNETTEPALVRFERASALVLSGELDEGCRFAAGTVLDPRTYHSVTVRGRARKFDDLLGQRRSAAVDDWRAVMRESYSEPLPSAAASASGSAALPSASRSPALPSASAPTTPALLPAQRHAPGST